MEGKVFSKDENNSKMTGSTEKSIGEGGKIKLLTGVVISILPLLVFKYYNCICESASAMLQMVGMRHELAGLNWAVPVGISFFTFQALSYTIDIYRRKETEKPSLLNFTLYTAFFPTILSGPIEGGEV